jgi:uncharacterized protein involved in exopolysaccharide biosynthesis/Mrp family chromosome partitioning ATPase
MELMNFLKNLKRYKAVLILVPIATAIAAFLISRNLPDKYISHARLASSSADKSQQLVSEKQQEESKINLEFNNLLQTLTLNKIMDRVSYKLILHELQATPFRTPSKLMKEMSPEKKQIAIREFTTRYITRATLSPVNKDEKALHKLLKSMKYDYESLKKNIIASRMDNSQYINLEYASENPQLSAFVLNTLSDEFINYYTSVSTSNKLNSLNFLDSLRQVKELALAQQEEALKKYKIENGILNIDDQAKTIYETIAAMEAKKNNAEKDMVAYNAALKNIDSRFTPENRKYFESSVSGINSEIVAIKDQIKAANDAYVQSGFNEQHKAQIDSLQAKLTNRIHAQTDNISSNPLAAKDNLVAQKLSMEVSRDLAQNSVQTFGKELGKLNSHLQKLVPNLATIQALQAKIEVASKEYTDILQKYNQANVEANASLPVKIVERALPGDPAPDKKIVLVALSAVVSFILCVFVLFIMFYFDNTIHSTEQLENLIDITVLGSLNKIKVGAVNVQDLWNKDITDKNHQEFKSSLRSIRYEIENSIQKDDKIIAITSLNDKEGKTFFTESLAYALSRTNKKVLIIDGNFTHPEISNTINGPNFIESFLLQDSDAKMVDNDMITVIGNRGGDGSLLELNSSKNIKDFFTVLKSIYDVIIVETSALESINKANAKEWISFVDKVVVVFESGRKLDETTTRHIHYLKELGSKLAGMVFNKVPTVPTSVNYNLAIDKPKNEKAAYS